MYTLVQYRVIVCLCRCVSLLCATSSSPEPILLPLRWAFSILWWLFLLTRSAMCVREFVCVYVCWIYLCYPAAYLFVRSRNMFDLFVVTCNKTGEISNVACNLLRYIYKSYNILRLFDFSHDIRLLFSILNSVYICSLHMLLQNTEKLQRIFAIIWDYVVHIWFH